MKSEAMALRGDPLRSSDLEALARSGIDVQLAERALLRRVDSATGAEIVDRNGAGDYSGVVFPYFWPGDDHPREYRLRLDRPEMEWSHDALKPKAKYLSPPGRCPMLYFAPETPPELLDDITLPIIITEGEKKTLALWAVDWHALGDTAERPRWLPIGLAGVWSWRGKRGRTQGPRGEWLSIKGPIPDLDRVAWLNRDVIILFDSNVRTNPDVQEARRRLAADLETRGAKVKFVDIPPEANVNGVDDLLGLWGSARVLELICSQAYEPVRKPIILSDTGNAERFAEEHRGDVHFCHQSNTWLIWDDMRFAPDQDAEVERLAKATVRQMHRDAFDIPEKEKELRDATIKFAMRSENDHNIRAMLNRAAAEEGVPILMNQLDADQWLLNVKNGTIDLRTGDLREHCREDLITKLAPVIYDSQARCPRWLQFLDEVFAPHPDAIPFVQRAVGHSLTGDVSEECLFMCYGTGRNGKGSLLKTLQAFLGDYSLTCDFSTFMLRGDDRGPRDDVANMRGRRFVVSQEAREGSALAESLVKWLTGGDMVRARNLYERSYEWLPTHHLWLAVNHKPIIRGTDVGIWSRIRLIPFSVSFEGREDRNLKAALLSEGPGILKWAIEGCLAWQREGLGTCDAVKDATSAYKTESDQIARFIDDRCVTLFTAQVRARKLYEAYRYWAEKGGEDVISETSFGLNLIERGFEKDRDSKGAVYMKIGLRG